MLLTTINESDPIYQFCEACIDRYIETKDDSWFSILVEDVLPDDEAIKILRAEGNTAGDAFAQIAADAEKLHWNPFKARKMVEDIGDMPSRAMGIGVHQPQNKSIASTAFWNHKNTRRAIGALTYGSMALGALSKINEYRNKPKTAISAKIASLRKILMKYQKKAEKARGTKEGNVFKTICGKIAGAINTLLKFIQEKTDKYFGD